MIEHFQQQIDNHPKKDDVNPTLFYLIFSEGPPNEESDLKIPSINLEMKSIKKDELNEEIFENLEFVRLTGPNHFPNFRIKK